MHFKSQFDGEIFLSVAGEHVYITEVFLGMQFGDHSIVVKSRTQ